MVDQSPVPSAARRARLCQLIRTLSLLEGGDFTLASGKTSGFFFDMKRTMLDAEGADLLADAVLDQIGDEPVDCVGGLVMGAVPLVAAVLVKSAARGRPLRGFFVRKEAKDHGTRKLIDGHLPDGARVVMLEDVTTTGGSVLKAIEAAQERHVRIIKVITIVDRLEGAGERLAKEGIVLEAVFTRKDFAPR